MIRQGRLLAGLMAVMLTASPALLRADDDEELAQAALLPDAALFVRLHVPNSLGIIERAGSNRNTGAMLRFARLASAAVLGRDFFALDSWRGAGLTSDSLVGSIGRIDGTEVRAAYRALDGTPVWDERGVGGLALPLWHSRFAYRGDAKLTEKALGRVRLVTSSAPQLQGKQLAELTGGQPGEIATIARSLRGVGVRWAGRLGGTTYLFLRQRGDTVLVDVIIPFGGLPLRWSRDRVRLLAHLSAGRDRSAPELSVFPATESTMLLPAESVAGALGALKHHLAASSRLESRKRQTGTPAPLPGEDRRCASLRNAAPTGPIRAARVSVRLDNDLRTTVTYYGRGQALAALLPLASDGIAVNELDQSAPLHGGVYLAGTAGLRALSRPEALATWESYRSTMRRCPEDGLLSQALFAWPLSAGLFLEEVAKLGTHAERVIAGLRNSAFAVRALPTDGGRPDGVLELSLAGDDSIRETARVLLETVFSKPTRHRTGDLYGAGSLQAHTRPHRRLLVVGATLGRSGRQVRNWFRRLRSKQPVAPERAVHLRLNGTDTLVWAGKQLFGAGAALSLLRGFRAVRGRVDVTGSDIETTVWAEFSK